jgi:RNA polymerase sigma-70 factor, ECF subfamily
MSESSPVSLIDQPEFTERLKAYDESAFNTLIESFKDRVYNLSLRITKNADEAEEVVQETFLSVFDKIQTFQGKSRLTTWIYAIAYNGALNRIKKTEHKNVTFEEETHLTIDPGWLRNKGVEIDFGTEGSVLRKELQELLEKAIQSLPDGYRELFIMKELNHLSVKEIAEIVKLNPGAVKTRLHRARLILRAKLSDYWNND